MEVLSWRLFLWRQCCLGQHQRNGVFRQYAITHTLPTQDSKSETPEIYCKRFYSGCCIYKQRANHKSPARTQRHCLLCLHMDILQVRQQNVNTNTEASNPRHVDEIMMYSSMLTAARYWTSYRFLLFQISGTLFSALRHTAVILLVSFCSKFLNLLPRTQIWAVIFTENKLKWMTWLSIL